MQKKKNNNNISIINFINKLLICTIIFLTLGIISKTNINYKEKIKDELYKKSINFSYFKKIYNKYLGEISIIKEKRNNTEQVFNEKLNYSKITKHEEGIKLETTEKYLVPNLDTGIVTFIGKKEKYNNVIIIENNEGIEIWYGNICNTNLKLYDNVNKNQIIGESCDNYIYLVFKQKDKIIDYKKYIT